MNLMKLILIITLSFFVSAVSFQNYKTKKTEIAKGVFKVDKISTKTGKVISSSTKISVNGQLYEAEMKNGSWSLSVEGEKAMQEAESSGGDSSGGGGGC